MWKVTRSDELYHHGILGQKWGVRRFQTYNGTLTPEGKERYGQGSSEEKANNKTTEEYEKEGEAFYKPVYDSAYKYTQDEGIDFLENDPKCKELVKTINAKTNKLQAELSACYSAERQAKQIANRIGPNKKERMAKYESAKHDTAKAYYNYSKEFMSITNEYIDKFFDESDRDKARAAVFWAFMD